MSTPTERCEWCGGDVLPGTTCPRSVTCPRCGAASGQSCRRPSGHRADTLHAGRVELAESMDAELAAPGFGGLFPHETQLAMDVAVDLARGWPWAT